MSRRASRVLGIARERRMSVAGGQVAPHNRMRKKREGTPDKSATPSQEAHDENRPPSRQIIWDAEIEKLQIKPDDLEKLHIPRPPSEPSAPAALSTVTVRKMKPASELNKPKVKEVMVAKVAPPDAPLKPVDYAGHGGPRYDIAGRVIPYSILGSYDDFRREATKRGDLLDIPTPRISDGFSDEKLTLKYERKKSRQAKKMQIDVDESSALRNWQLKMIERKRQQGYISKLLQKPPELLAMNYAETYRKIQEDRYLIDRTIPCLDYGKGSRIGSEFWTQQARIGDETMGIHVTLTQTERGYPPPVEHVGIPQSMRLEKGITWQPVSKSPAHNPWHRSTYLHARLKQLQPIIDELDPHRPDFASLEVIGTNKLYKKDRDIQEDNSLPRNFSEQTAFDQSALMMQAPDLNDPFHDYPDVRSPPVFGPSLIFAGQSACWTGDSNSMANQVGIEARVTFEGYTDNRVTSYLEIINDGTTSIYYNWKKLPKQNVFKLAQQPVQKFYFNDSSDVILPGEILKVPFVFKSECAGVFTEQWLLETRPAVCGGAALVVTLRGVCLQEDTYRQQRMELERDLAERQCHQMVRQIIDELLSGIRTPERPHSPVDAYITEEEIFHRNNPGLSYRHDLVQELKLIHSQLFAEDERQYAIWDLSVLDLQDLIMEMDDDDNDEKKEALMTQMNAAVAKLTFAPLLPVQEKLEMFCHEILAEAVDAIVDQAMLLRHTLGLPVRDMGDVVDETGDSKKGPRPSEKGKPETSKDKKPTVVTGSAAAAGGGAAAVAAAPAKTGKGTKEPQKAEPKGKAPTPAAVKKVTGPARSTGATPAGGVEPATATPTSPPQSPVSQEQEIALDRKYREKLCVKVHLILGDKMAKMDAIFQDIMKLDPTFTSIPTK